MDYTIQYTSAADGSAQMSDGSTVSFSFKANATSACPGQKITVDYSVEGNYALWFCACEIYSG